ncbi:MAG TPA: hypothetical protein VLK65_32805 [Vicinamibacteria bacterium]|nr:hypothetical protein [Vicinamibacteria bacterium]
MRNQFSRFRAVFSWILVAGYAACLPGEKLKPEEPSTKSARPEKQPLERAKPRSYRIDPDATFRPELPQGMTAIYVEASVDEVAADFVPATNEKVDEIYVSEPPEPARHDDMTGRGTAEPVRPVSDSPVRKSSRAESRLDIRAPIPAAPALTSSFESTNFDTNATNTGGFVFIPPDPIAAAGPDHLVNVSNVTVRFHQKNGALDLNASLANFFTLLAPANFTFDPKVLYDHFEGRFVIVTLELVDNGVCASVPACTSRILVAVSDDADPNGTWTMTSINSELLIGSTNHWADYPGFALDEEAVYITTNMFEFEVDGTTFGGVRLWVIEKGIGTGGFYDGGMAMVTLLDPYAGAGLAAATQPAMIFGSPPANVGTFLVSHSGLTGGGNEFVQVVRLDHPLTTPTFTQEFINVGNIDNNAGSLPDAPQSGTATLVEVNDRRALNAVWKDDFLVMTATILPNFGPDIGETTAIWWQLNTSTLGATTLADWGTIGGEDIAADTRTFFPSIAINGANELAVGFSASAATIFGGSYYTTRSPGDPAGTTSGSQTLRAGTDFYVRTFGGPQNRWGDYSGTAADPVTGCFWIYNEHAITRGSLIMGEDGRWGTAYGEVCPPTGTCMPDLVISNVTLSGNVIRGARNTILAGPNVNVQSGANATFKAGASVALGNGFSVEASASFVVELDANAPCL